jgi:hypothetical protein
LHDLSFPAWWLLVAIVVGFLATLWRVALAEPRMCRVSTQITGKPASASALKSHCDNGPASGPIRLKR